MSLQKDPAENERIKAILEQLQKVGQSQTFLKKWVNPTTSNICTAHFVHIAQCHDSFRQQNLSFVH